MAHVEVTIKIPVDCDPVTAQRINQVARAVMNQFPGIDSGPQHPFRMFLTTLDAFQEKLDGEDTKPTPVEVQEDTAPAVEPAGVHEVVDDLVQAYTQQWENRELDRAAVLMKYMVSPAGKRARQLLERVENPTQYLVERGATPEQASNLVAVGTAMQLIHL